MTAHIHRDCMIAHAEDTTRRLEYWSEDQGRWKQAAKIGDPVWFKHVRFRVIDHDVNVVAETPAPKPPRVRIPECTLPAPLTQAEQRRLKRVWIVNNYSGVVSEWPVTDGASGPKLCWDTREDAQEWMDALTADREVVGDE